VTGVRHHHLRWDGGGQADGLAGDRIPAIARALAVAERYEALSAGRACDRLSPQDAVRKVAEGSGTEFDPAAVEALNRAVQDGSLELNPPAIALPATVAAPA
jgi:response regulator RpfG family c-di-GMP phosphodiesterase